jgi:hypothetical protein
MRPWLSRLSSLAGAHSLARRYAKGFYAYALGSSLERFGEIAEAKHHLEESFGLLMPFRTELATTVKRLLGLKMNCFDVLRGCNANSPFAPADAFFNNQSVATGSGFLRMPASQKGVYIDPFSKLFLDGLLCYYDLDDSALTPIINALSRDALAREKNNQDKVNVLAARWHMRRGNQDQAALAYQTLQHDPIFGEEARDFLRCLLKNTENPPKHR